MHAVGGVFYECLRLWRGKAGFELGAIDSGRCRHFKDWIFAVRVSRLPAFFLGRGERLFMVFPEGFVALLLGTECTAGERSA